MAFDPREFDVERWMKLENENLLQKVCSVYDDEGRLVEQYKTRVSVAPIGQIGQFLTFASTSAPSLYRAYWYDEKGAMIARIPYMREWTQACEDAATGGVLIPGDPSILPHGLVAAPTLIHYEEDLAVPVTTTTKVLSYTVPANEKSYARNIRVSGDNRAVYTIFKNAVKIREIRTWWTSFDAETQFDSADGGLLLEETDSIEVFVYNYGSDPVRFSASLSFVNTQ